MLRGLYTGSSGMVAQRHRLDALSNNLANVNLTGYKADLSIQKAFPEMLIRRLHDDGLFKMPQGYLETAPIVGRLGTGVEQNEVYTDFSQGSLQQTENPFDLALEGQGAFFAISTPQGERYTRNGSFVLGPEGLLVTKDGFPVLGENGSIRLQENNFTIDKKGRIIHNAALADDPSRLVSLRENEWEAEELLDTLRIVEFERPRYLEKQGNSLWRQTELSGNAQTFSFVERPHLHQGFLESANVNPVTEMVRMIEVNRAYEANQKTISTQDELLGKLINEVGLFGAS